MFTTMDTSSAISAISNLGLSEASSAVFIDLTSNGTSTVVEISKRTDIPRPSVYRAISELQTLDLVQFDGHDRTHYRANEYKNLKKLVIAQEEKTQRLTNSLPELFGYLLNIGGKSSSTTEINHFEGFKGLEQVALNTMNARGTFRAFESASLNNFLDVDLAEHIRKDSIEKKITSLQVCNSKSTPDFTNVEGFVNKWWFLRYISPKLLPVEVDIWIYNDTVVIYNYEDEQFAVEITNEKLARMQRTQFDFIWKQAKKMTFKGTHGAARLEP